MSKCLRCEGERWVCENHRDVPWGDGDRCCGGAGAPCPDCNPCGGPDDPPLMPPGTTIIWGDDPKVH